MTKLPTKRIQENIKPKEPNHGALFSLLQCSFAKACHSFGAFFFGPCPMAQKMLNGNPLLNQMVIIWGLLKGLAAEPKIYVTLTSTSIMEVAIPPIFELFPFI